MAYPAILYRYDELQFAEPFVERGIVSFGAAARYNDSKLSDAQRDNEQRRQLSLKMPGHQLAIAQPGEAHANVILNLFKIEIKFDIRLMASFCVIISCAFLSKRSPSSTLSFQRLTA
jgi:hypothetical protein